MAFLYLSAGHTVASPRLDEGIVQIEKARSYCRIRTASSTVGGHLHSALRPFCCAALLLLLVLPFSTINLFKNVTSRF